MSTPSTSRGGTPAAGAARRSSVIPPKVQSTSTSSKSPARTTTPTTPTSTTAGAVKPRPTRTNSGAPTSARAAARRPLSMSYPSKSATADGSAEDDSRAQAAAALEDMRERLQKAELTAEEHQKQAAVLQARLDESTKEQSKLEESLHEQQEKMEELGNENKDNLRKRRELEAIYEAEQAAAMKEREDSQAREEELRSALQRVKETMAQKDLRVDDEKRPDTSRTSSFRSNSSPNMEGGHFAPPASLERSDSRSSSRLVLQKDKIIESLRLELAEAQIKIAELESMGGGRMQELERTLMEARVTNARLMEDNESFQLLLAEKTISGDFAANFLKPLSDFGSRPSSRDGPAASSLADELDSAAETETTSADQKKYHAELTALKDQNKALSLYINNIITRLLQHKEFENILDRTPRPLGAPSMPAARPNDANVDKDLPPPPPEKDEPTPSFIQRATSVMRGRPRPGPLSPTEGPGAPGATVTEDPLTAPRIPLGRPNPARVTSGGHRRANSEWSHASVVNNMYRGPSPVSGQISPGIPPQRASTFFSGGPMNANPTVAARVPSSSSMPRFNEPSDRRESLQMPPPLSSASSSSNTNHDSKIGSSNRDSMVSEPENAGNPASPPRSTTSSSDKPTGPSGAIMEGRKMRPLRLVQETNEQVEAAKKANRASWMGWFNKGASTAPPPQPLQRSMSGEILPKE